MRSEMEDSCKGQLLKCPVCCDNISDTSRLLNKPDWKHSVCHICLKKVLEGRNITCSLCNVVNQLKQCDENHISGGASGECPLGKKCTQCDENTAAVKFCEKCEEFMCNVCTNAHKRTKITKDHTLLDVARQEVRNEMQLEEVYCKTEQHHDCLIDKYCIKCNKDICDKCATEKHEGHHIKPLKEVASEKHNQLKSVLQEIKQKGYHNMKEILEAKSARTKEMEEKMKEGLARQFDNYMTVLETRCGSLKKQVEEKAKLYLENASEVLSNIQDKLKEAELLYNEQNAMVFMSSCRDTIKALKKCERNIAKLPEVFDLRYSQVCTTDDFEKLVNALGSIQDSNQPSLNSHADENVSLSADLNSQSSPALSGESSGTMHLMDVLKSISQTGDRSFHELSYRSSKLNSSRDTQSINNETFTIQNVNSLGQENIPNPVSLTEKNMPKSKRELIQLDSVREMVNIRFETWGLQGWWKTEDDKVEIFSRSQEEADHCMQLLQETILEKSIPLRRDSKFIVESDKWQIITSMLRKKFKEQVQIDVSHTECVVKVYSASMFILNDSCDVIRNFLRDNQMKRVTLHYDERIVAFIMKNKSKLKKIRESFSQYCLDISPVNKTDICLTGISFGVGQAIQKVNILASTFAKASDEDRFDSDTDEDEDERFSDDDGDNVQVEPKVDVLISLATEEGTEAEIKAICFPGDDRLLYVVAGDMIYLPVEVLVNAADKKLKHNGGLAKSLVTKGGRSIQEECSYHVDKYGEIEIGQVFCSDAGTLASTKIIHAVGPKWIDGNQQEKDKLFECVTNCLKSASKYKLASVAFPAISAGTYKFPIREATLTILKAVKDFLQQEPRCCIREIYFCDRDMITANVFASSMKATFHGADTVLSGDQSQSKEAPGADERGNNVRQIFLI